MSSSPNDVSVPRLSSPVSQMSDHYDVVVVGSGYGGAIAASRCARAGRSVCLLERGREIHPGEYPETLDEGKDEMQANTAEGRIGSRLGMFEFHLNDDMHALVGCGLGGTSLINANVSLRATDDVWDHPHWPEALRGDERLEAAYDRAEAMLQPTPYPDDYPELDKLSALEASGEEVDAEFYRPPINVTFEDGTNHVGIEQRACVNCGDCVSGCNYGAKNTTLMNYLPDARSHGAELYTRVEVRRVAREGDDWRVYYQLRSPGRARFDPPASFVSADMVILAAGTFGSTEILMRSRDRGLAVSDRLGDRFSGNGDVLGFGYNCDRPIRGVGFGNERTDDHEPVGPCITGILDGRGTPGQAEDFVIEEGAIPGAVRELLPGLMASGAAAIGEDTDAGVFDEISEKGRALQSVIMGPYRGAVNRTQTYLVMSHDGADGTLELEEDRIRVHWPDVGTKAIFEHVDEILEDATRPLGGTYVRNPIWDDLLGHDLITVHPLGGCPMGEDASEGVVNHKGEVFSGSQAADVHDGLYVADGSVIPTSMGVNPLLTISALAERTCALMAEDRDWTIDYSLPSGPPPTPAPEAPGLEFSERMTGHFSVGETDSFEEAEQRGRRENSPMSFTLTIVSEDLEAMLESPAHEATLVGEVSVPALSPHPMTARDGTFQLFVEDPERVDTREMNYRMVLEAEDGRQFLFEGVKHIDESAPWEVWEETTTLYVTLREGTESDGPVVGKGVLHIEPEDLLRQLRSMRVTGAENRRERLRLMARFGRFFGGVLWRHYGGVLDPDSYFDPEAPPRKKRHLRAPAPEVRPFETSDGVTLRLTRYQGGDKGPVLLSHGMGVSSRIFDTDLPDTNLVEFLAAEGYDLWLLDHRVSFELAAAEQRSTGDQIARIDVPEAVSRVLDHTGANSLQAVVHCYGANTFFMSLLDGLEGVRSVVASQVATDLVTPTLTSVKAGLHMAEFLDGLGVDSMTAYVDTESNWRQKLLDRALELQPLPEDQRCDSPVCQRITFLYSLLYQHEQLGPRIHDHLHELFGVGNIAAFEHLSTMVRAEKVVTHEGDDPYLPHLDRLALPIRFIHGAENSCYLPESTKRTYDRLVEAHGEALYSRTVIPEYGHIDCIFGRRAAEDVYPHILEHLEETA